MHRWARFTCIFLAFVTLAAAALAQLQSIAPQTSTASSDPTPSDARTNAVKEKDILARHQAALALLNVVIAGSKNLMLPHNRIVIASEAFPLLWSRNQAQARALVSQMIGDFAQASSREQETLALNDRQMLHQQWQIVLRTIAQSDAELALSFLNATSAFVEIGDPDQLEAEQRSLRLELAAQEAEHNPRNALRLAEKNLRNPGDLPFELINLLSQIESKDPEAGTQLLHEIVARVRGAGLSSGDANFNFALNLLNTQNNSQPNGAAPDDAMKSLADAIASAALNPEFPPTMLPMLQGSVQTFEKFAPARVPALRQRVDEFTRSFNPQQRSWDEFNAAQATGDPNQLLAVADQASPDVRGSMYQNIAWQFASNGNLQRAREMADKLTDPFQRQQVLQQALQQSAFNAANQAQFAAARQLAQEITPDESRATVLAQLALIAAGARQQAMAQEMLEEAGGLLANRGTGTSVFSAQLQVAQAFARVKPDRAIPLLEQSAAQLELVLAAALQVDAFLPYQRSFEGGELILHQSFLCNSLIRPYAEATAQLATQDLAAARILADRLSLPEARLFAELLIARAALDEENAPAAFAHVRSGMIVTEIRN